MTGNAENRAIDVTQRLSMASTEKPSFVLPMPMTDGCASAWKILKILMSLALICSSLQSGAAV
jgi:hypothetical protein